MLKEKLEKFVEKNIIEFGHDYIRNSDFEHQLAYLLQEQFYYDNDLGGGHSINISNVDFENRLIYATTIQEYGGSGDWYIINGIYMEVFKIEEHEEKVIVFDRVKKIVLREGNFEERN